MKFSSLQILFMGKRLYKSGKTTDTETLHDSNPVVNAAEVIKLPDGCAECKCLYKNATLWCSRKVQHNKEIVTSCTIAEANALEDAVGQIKVGPGFVNNMRASTLGDTG